MTGFNRFFLALILLSSIDVYGAILQPPAFFRRAKQINCVSVFVGGRINYSDIDKLRTELVKFASAALAENMDPKILEKVDAIIDYKFLEPRKIIGARVIESHKDIEATQISMLTINKRIETHLEINNTVLNYKSAYYASVIGLAAIPLTILAAIYQPALTSLPLTGTMLSSIVLDQAPRAWLTFNDGTLSQLTKATNKFLYDPNIATASWSTTKPIERHIINEASYGRIPYMHLDSSIRSDRSPTLVNKMVQAMLNDRTLAQLSSRQRANVEHLQEKIPLTIDVFYYRKNNGTPTMLISASISE